MLLPLLTVFWTNYRNLLLLLSYRYIVDAYIFYCLFFALVNVFICCALLFTLVLGNVFICCACALYLFHCGNVGQWETSFRLFVCLVHVKKLTIKLTWLCAASGRHGGLVSGPRGRDSAGALRCVPHQPGGSSLLLPLQQVWAVLQPAETDLRSDPQVGVITADPWAV